MTDGIDQGAWEHIGGIGVDAATVAFGDRSVLGPNFVLPTELVPRHDEWTVAPPGLSGSIVVEITGADIDVPVEVVKDPNGSVVAARMTFVDLDDVAGKWCKIGELVVTSGHCLACDPWCEDDVYRLEFDVLPGRYLAESFQWAEGGEALALRIRLVSYDGELP